jgi:hypothetical protein
MEILLWIILGVWFIQAVVDEDRAVIESMKNGEQHEN